MAVCWQLSPARCNLEQVARVDHHKVVWRGHDCVACVVKAVRASYVYVTAYMTFTADARRPENTSKLRQISGLLLKQRRELQYAASFHRLVEEWKDCEELKRSRKKSGLSWTRKERRRNIERSGVLKPTSIGV